MSWSSLADINTLEVEEVDEYHSRPDDRLRELVRQTPGEVVVYGARGKFSRHVSLMLLRALKETGATSRTVHLVSSTRPDPDFDAVVAPYAEFTRQHHIDLTVAEASDLASIPRHAPWVLYLAGYKFVAPGQSDRDYGLMCDLYGMVIPSLVVTHHQEGARIVVMGSGNGLPFSPVDEPADESVALAPRKGNHYGQSILDKERVIHAILEGRSLSNASSAVILRGGYFTDAATYGGLEPEILAVMKGQEIDLSSKAYFNLLSHRDAALATLLCAPLARAGISTFNLAGPLVNVREAVDLIARELRRYEEYEHARPHVTGKPAETHLLMDDRLLQSKVGKPLDSLEELIHAQVYWLARGGHRRGLDHKIGKSL